MTVLKGKLGCGETMVRYTRALPRHLRAAYWREAVAAVLPSLTVDYQTGEPPDARLESRSFADAQISAFIDNTAICRVTHTPSRLRWPDAYLLVLQCAGHGCYRHAGCEVRLKAGDLVLLDMSRRLQLRFPKRHHELVWVLPRAALAPLLAAPERLPVGISGRRGFGALLAASMRTLAGEAGRLDPASQKSLRIHLCSLAALAVAAAIPADPLRRKTYRLVRRQQIHAYVETHFREADLSAERAARDLKMSRRWLHELFSEGGTSFAAWVARRRIEECRRLLEDPQHDQLSITDVAFQNGFNDLSTFYRQFRAHCERQPREVRRGRPLVKDA